MRLNILSYFGFSALSYSYILDSSCNQYSDLVKAGMDGAFDMAEVAYHLIDSPSTDRNILRAQQDITRYMFNSTLTDSTKKSTVYYRFKDILKWDTNNGAPSEILDATRDRATYPTLKSDELIIFCDQSRFRENQLCDGTYYSNVACDTLTQINRAMDDSYKGCQDPTSGLDCHAWAVPVERSLGVDKASHIQLCPWYLTNIRSKRYQVVQDLGDQGGLALPREMIRNIGRGWAPMDIMRSLIDVALLHELTHALIDSRPTGDYGYKWDNCRDLSSQGNIDNADSYSLFGLGAKLISPASRTAIAQRPMRDGTIQELRSTTRSKRAGRPEPLEVRDTDTTSSKFKSSAASTFQTSTSVGSSPATTTKSSPQSSISSFSLSKASSSACSTGTVCSAPVTGSKVTTTQSHSMASIVSVSGDDFDSPDLIDQQQSLISLFLADTTDARVTWSSDEVTSTTKSSSGTITTPVRTTAKQSASSCSVLVEELGSTYEWMCGDGVTSTTKPSPVITTTHATTTHATTTAKQSSSSCSVWVEELSSSYEWMC